MSLQLNQIQTNINYRKKNEQSFKGMFKMLPMDIELNMLANIGKNYTESDKFLKYVDEASSTVYFICENHHNSKLLKELSEYPYLGKVKVIMNNVDLYNNKDKSKYAKTLQYIKTFFNN